MSRVTVTFFAQIVKFISQVDFQKCVARYQGDKHAKGVTCWSQFIAMLYSQLSGADSLREICHGLFSCMGKLKHLNASPIARSSLAYANEHRSYKIIQDLYFLLLKRYEKQLHITLPRSFSKPVFSLDSTTISLCLRLYDWAKYRRRKGGIKLHTRLNHATLLPDMVVETTAKISDIKAAREHIEFPPGSIVVMDRGYNDYSLFKKLTERDCLFVTRLKENAVHTPLKDGVIKEVPDKYGVYKMKFTGPKARKVCGDTEFRVIQWFDEESGRWFDFLTNDMEMTAEEIAQLYKDRWLVELFFKKVKQNLKILSFVGTSENAVLTQIWTALVSLLLLEILRRQSAYKWSFSNFISAVRLNLLTCKDLGEWLKKPDIKDWGEDPGGERQLGLIF